MPNQGKHKRIYLGWTSDGYELLRPVRTPTPRTHGGKYAAIWGPFRTLRGAKWGREHWRQCYSVEDAKQQARETSRAA